MFLPKSLVFSKNNVTFATIFNIINTINIGSLLI